MQKKKPTAASLDGWGSRELKSVRFAWFEKLAKILSLVAVSGVRPDGILDAHIAMIPEVDEDATPFGQRPVCVLPIVYGLWTSGQASALGWLVPVLGSYFF